MLLVGALHPDNDVSIVALRCLEGEAIWWIEIEIDHLSLSILSAVCATIINGCHTTWT